jgi:hypothetical protein
MRSFLLTTGNKISSTPEAYTKAQQALLDTAVKMFEGLSPDDQQMMLALMEEVCSDGN